MECVRGAGKPGSTIGRVGGVCAFGGDVLVGGAAIGRDLAAAGVDGLSGVGRGVSVGAGAGHGRAGARPGAGGGWQPLVGVVGGAFGRAAVVCPAPFGLDAGGTAADLAAGSVGRLAKSQLGIWLAAGVGHAGCPDLAAQTVVGVRIDSGCGWWCLVVGAGPVDGVVSNGCL